jgi:hypothetical protein
MAVAPKLVADFKVPAGNKTCPTNLIVAPFTTNIFIRVAVEAVVVAPELLNLIPSTLEPLEPAVTNVTNVPPPLLSVFAAAILAGCKLPVKTKIGVVFTGISYIF